MSHSYGLLPLDPVSWLEVLIRAGGTEGAKDAGGTRKKRERKEVKKKKSLIHQWPPCAAMPPHVFISPHLIGVWNAYLSHVSLRGGGQLACIQHLSQADGGADVTGSSSWRAGATLTMLIVSADHIKPFESEGTHIMQWHYTDSKKTNWFIWLFGYLGILRFYRFLD